ncbi:MAG: P-loop NTPase [Pseudomonadota bacterium]
MLKFAKRSKKDDNAAAAPAPKAASAQRLDCVAFVADNQTHGVVSIVVKQLFGKSQVRDGGSREALEFLAESATPGLLIVDVTDESKPLNALLPIVASFIDDTKVIAIGNVNDVQFYHEVIEAGVADYLVKPITEKALTAAINRITTPTTAGQADNRRVVAVIGARGGVGASLVAVNCAWLLAQEQKRPTTLLDLDLQNGTVALALDIEPTRGLREALEHPARIDSLFISSASVKLGERLHVMAAEEPVDEDVHYDAAGVTLLLDAIKRQAECIVVDLPRGAIRARSRVLAAATDVLLVTDLTLAALRDAIRVQAQVQQAAPNARILLVANRCGSRDAALARAEFERALGRKIDLLLPDDPKAAQQAASAGKPLCAVAPSSKTTAALRTLVGRFGNVNAERRRWSLWRRRRG